MTVRIIADTHHIDLADSADALLSRALGHDIEALDGRIAGGMIGPLAIACRRLRQSATDSTAATVARTIREIGRLMAFGIANPRTALSVARTDEGVREAA